MGTSRWRMLATVSVVSLRLVVIIATVAEPAQGSATLARLRVPEESGALLLCPSWLGGDSVKRG